MGVIECTCKKCGKSFQEKGKRRNICWACRSCIRRRCIDCGEFYVGQRRRCGSCYEKRLEHARVCVDCEAPFTGTKRRCPPCQAKYMAGWYAGRKTDLLAAARFKRYGMTPEQYVEKFKAQDGRCGICGKAESQANSVDGNLGVDHDHRCCSGRRSCGKCLRDLLCRRCNALLGLADDDVAVLQAALAYLQRWSAD